MDTLNIDGLLQENEILRRRLEEAEEALRALRAGEVDAVFVESGCHQVYTLETTDKPYRLLVEQMPHGAATLTLDGTILACNRPLEKLLKQPAHSLIGKPIQEFVADESRDFFESLIREAVEADVETDVVLQGSDGERVPAYLAIREVREGALGQCLLLSDLTEKRQLEMLQRAQKALRESEERLARDLAAARQLQEISTHLICEGDVEQLYGRLVDAAAAIMHSDFATMQMLDKETASLRLLAYRGFSEDFARSFQTVQPETNATCAMAWRNRRRVVASDLETFDGIAGTESCRAHLNAGVRAAQSTPLFSRAGDMLGTISTHWRMPCEPSESDLRLLDILARQAADLIERNRTEQALRDADRRKDEFLATMAHELRNPLAPIRNATQLLKAKGPPVPELQWARGVIDRQVQLMSRLLEDLLDVSRITRNQLELRRELIDLADVVEAALETSRPTIDAANHALTVTLPDEPIWLEADPVRLAQVFANLLNNAAKYTEEGGHVRLSARTEGSHVVVSVQDTGIGIAPDMLPHVFDIFSRAKPAVTRSQGGLGIGLSLVKGLVQLHGGTIEAKSAGAGRGSEFLVRLPVTKEVPLQKLSESAPHAEQKTVAARRILIVDDNPDGADTLAMLLKVLGHHVNVAYDGQQALEAAESLRPDVVLLDIGMPKLDGYEACRRIRQQPWGKNVFLIALTGWGQDEDRRRTQDAGFDHHMIKPVDTVELMKLLSAP